MRKIELTEDRIEQAARAMYIAFPVDDPDEYNTWDEMPETHKGEWKIAARAAAPFLQFPIAEPTGSELDVAGKTLLPFCSMYSRSLARSILLEFTENRDRNALPPPPDPLEQKIIDVLHNESIGTESDAFRRKVARRILAALEIK